MSRPATPDEMAAFNEAWKAGKAPDLLRESDSATLAALGIPTSVGDLDITFNPESIARLGVIGSPFVSNGEGGDLELSEQDIANAVYAMSGGPSAIAPLLPMRQRRKQLNTRVDQARALGAEFYAAWLEKDMALAEVWTRYESDAAAYFASHCGDMSLQDVTDALVDGLADAFSWADAISGDEKKTTDSSASTANGSGGSWAEWWRSASRWIRQWRDHLLLRAG